MSHTRVKSALANAALALYKTPNDIVNAIALNPALIPFMTFDNPFSQWMMQKPIYPYALRAVAPFILVINDTIDAGLRDTAGFLRSRGKGELIAGIGRTIAVNGLAATAVCAEIYYRVTNHQDFYEQSWIDIENIFYNPLAEGALACGVYRATQMAINFAFDLATDPDKSKEQEPGEIKQAISQAHRVLTKTALSEFVRQWLIINGKTYDPLLFSILGWALVTVKEMGRALFYVPLEELAEDCKEQHQNRNDQAPVEEIELLDRGRTPTLQQQKLDEAPLIESQLGSERYEALKKLETTIDIEFTEIAEEQARAAELNESNNNDDFGYQVLAGEPQNLPPRPSICKLATDTLLRVTYNVSALAFGAYCINESKLFKSAQDPFTFTAGMHFATEGLYGLGRLANFGLFSARRVYDSVREKCCPRTPSI